MCACAVVGGSGGIFEKFLSPDKNSWDKFEPLNVKLWINIHLKSSVNG